MSHDVSHVRTLPAPTVKKMLRDAGWSLSRVAAIKPARHRTLVVRVVRKQIVSDPMWRRIEWCLQHPRREQVPA